MSRRKWTEEDREKHFNREQSRRARATCANCERRTAFYDVNRDGALVLECEACGCTTVVPRQVRRGPSARLWKA